MNIRTMKAIDHFVGIPVCLMLDLFQRIRSPFRCANHTPLRRVLVMKYFGIGSILLASPMLRTIKSRNPNVKIGFLTFAGNRDMVERLGLVDEIHTLRTDSLLHFACDLFRVIGRIRRKRYDATIDMEFFSKFSTIVTYLSGSPIRIGYFLRQMWRGDLLTEQVYYNNYKHITEVFGALAAPLDVTVDDFTLQPPLITDEERKAAGVLLTREGVGPEDLLIGFNVNASELSLERRWPKREFLTLARGLLNELNARLVFIGTPAEAEYVAEMVAELPRDGRIINLSGKTNLEDLVEILRRCRIFITNDSGPLHLAASLGIATVSFFGPETPMLYGPVGGDALVFYEGVYCSPCLNVFNVKTAPCSGQNVCMQGIHAEAVLDGMREHFSDIWGQYKRVV
ncbi:MAG: glycosyltransferase family 9 protein [Desulfuromonadales bacterium]|nr:glycosyltransferase family 9 protein [Desulfuromonadales bacterium]